MANISSLISLNAFVRRLLGKEGLDDDNHLRYMQIACDGIKNFHMHDFPLEVTKVVTVDSDTNTFDYPSDYIKYLAIATVIDGRWWIYNNDTSMVPLEDDDGTTIEDSLLNLSDYQHLSTLSTGGGEGKYMYREDHKNRRFQVSGDTPDIVILKYVSNGMDSAGSINIPMYAQSALEAYVRWQIAEYDNPALSRIQHLERRYNQERKNMRTIHRPTLQDLKDAIYKSSGQGPRR